MVAEEAGEVMGIGEAKGQADLGNGGLGVAEEVARAIENGVGDKGLGRSARLLAHQVAKIVGREEERLCAGGDGGKLRHRGIGRGGQGRGKVGFQARE